MIESDQLLVVDRTMSWNVQSGGSRGSAPVQLVVERAMYWNALGKVWAAGTNALATRFR